MQDFREQLNGARNMEKSGSDEEDKRNLFFGYKEDSCTESLK